MRHRVQHIARIAAAGAGGNRLAGLSDGFDGTALRSQWTVEDPNTNLTMTVSGGELGLEIDAGGPGQAFWYNANRGPLIYVPITGNFRAAMQIRVRNAADSGLPPVTQFRLAGLAAHDPDRTTLDYVHVALGATNEATLRAEHKSTVSDVSDPAGGTSPGFSSIAWASGEGWLFMDRTGQVFTLEVAATRLGARSLVRTVDRAAAPMPATLYVGPMIYSNQASPDVRAFVGGIEFS